MDNECHTPSVERIDLIIADVDCAEESEVAKLLETIERGGLGCDIYSTHSSGALQTELKYDDYVERCKTWNLDPWSREAAQRYLRDVEKYPEKIVAGAFVKQRCVQLSRLGTAVVFGHPPVIKLRIVFTLDQSSSITERFHPTRLPSRVGAGKMPSRTLRQSVTVDRPRKAATSSECNIRLAVLIVLPR